MTDLDGAVLDGIKRLQSGHDLTRGERLNLKLVVRGFGDVLGECFASTEQCIERFRPACGQAPPDGRR